MTLIIQWKCREESKEQKLLSKDGDYWGIFRNYSSSSQLYAIYKFTDTSKLLYDKVCGT